MSGTVFTLIIVGVIGVFITIWHAMNKGEDKRRRAAHKAKMIRQQVERPAEPAQTQPLQPIVRQPHVVVDVHVDISQDEGGG